MEDQSRFLPAWSLISVTIGEYEKIDYILSRSYFG